MEYLFRYVCDHMEYVDYGDTNNHPYLYDAVIRGKSNCDGYSNMLFLLFRLAGIEACEAMGDNNKNTTKQLPESVGHTWVVAKLDGTFYNFDATYEDTAMDGDEYMNIYFSYSDSLVDMKYINCDDMRPRCTDESRDFDFADLTIDDLETDNIQKAAQLADDRLEQGQQDTLIVVEKILESGDVDDFINAFVECTKNVSEISASYFGVTDFTVVKLTATPW